MDRQAEQAWLDTNDYAFHAPQAHQAGRMKIKKRFFRSHTKDLRDVTLECAAPKGRMIMHIIMLYAGTSRSGARRADGKRKDQSEARRADVLAGRMMQMPGRTKRLLVALCKSQVA